MSYIRDLVMTQIIETVAYHTAHCDHHHDIHEVEVPDGLSVHLEIEDIEKLHGMNIRIVKPLEDDSADH